MLTYYLAVFIQIFLDLYSFLLLARVLLSWVQKPLDHPVIFFIHDVTDPVLNLVKRFLPKTAMIDFSPVIVFFGIELIKNFFLYLLNAS